MTEFFRDLYDKSHDIELLKHACQETIASILTDDELSHAYSVWGEQRFCAGWYIVTPASIREFVEYLTTTPAELIIRRRKPNQT